MKVSMIAVTILALLSATLDAAPPRRPPAVPTIAPQAYAAQVAGISSCQQFSERLGILSPTELLEEAVKACKSEILEDPQNEEDEAYNQAIEHCVWAIRALTTKS